MKPIADKLVLAASVLTLIALVVLLCHKAREADRRARARGPCVESRDTGALVCTGTDSWMRCTHETECVRYANEAAR